jgi:hypothetical protein
MSLFNAGPDLPSASDRAEQVNKARDANPIDDNPAMGIWEKWEIASWTVGGQTYKFPVKIIEEDGGNRLVVRARPNRPGAKLDSTGGKEKKWTITALFWNGCKEPGLDPAVPLYPDVKNAIVASFDVQETGDLVVPSRGRVRARADTYRTVENVDTEWDSTLATFNFVADNEDAIGAASVSKMTARTSGPKIATQAKFDADGVDVAGDGGLDALIDSMNQLQGILNAPQTAIDDATATSNTISRNIDNLVAAFSDAAEPARSAFTDPSSHRLRRKLILLQDSCNDSSVTEGKGRARPTAPRTFNTTRSIYDIAAELGQDASALSELNEYRIEDQLSIEPGTIVLVLV